MEQNFINIKNKEEIPMASTKEQQTAIDDFSHQFQYIQASAGSGKTYTIIQKVKKAIELGVKPEDILLFSFSKKATEELNERLLLQGIPPVATTFHSFAHRLLLKGKYLEQLGFKSGYNIVSDYSFELQDEIDEAMKEKYLIHFDSSLLNKLKNNISCELLLDLLKALIDFRLLPIEPFLDEKHHQLIIVDEFQDTTFKEMEILKGLTLKNTLVNFVGDEKQALYRFRNDNLSGESIEKTLTEKQDTLALIAHAFGIKKEDIFTHHLTTNFRSGDGIVNLANSLFTNLHERAANKKENFIIHQDNDNADLYKMIKPHIRSQVKIGILVKTNHDVMEFYEKMKRVSKEHNEKWYVSFKVSQQAPNELTYKKALYKFMANQDRDSASELLKQKVETESLNIVLMLKKFKAFDQVLSNSKSMTFFSKLYDIPLNLSVNEMAEEIAAQIDLPLEFVFLAFLKNYPSHDFKLLFKEMVDEKLKFFHLQPTVFNKNEQIDMELLEDFEQALYSQQTNGQLNNLIFRFFSDSQYDELVNQRVNLAMDAPQIEISTIHMSKGGEYDIVLTNESYDNIQRVTRTKEQKETFNDNIYTQYVVITRAKEGLIFF